MAARGRGLFSLYIYIKNFKNLLVRNLWTEFNVIWQECCFGDLLPRLFKPSWYVKKHCSLGGRGLFSIYICIENFEIILVKYPHTDFNVALVTLYQECSSNPDLSKNMAARERGLISLYIYIKNFKNLLVRNLRTEFNVIWQECCFGELLPRLFKPSWYVKKHCSLGGEGLIFHIYLYRKLWNSSCQIPPHRFQCCFGDPLLRMFKQSRFVKKHGC